MTSTTLWTLPVPSTALLDGGPVFEKRLGREVALRFSDEGEVDARRSGAVVFRGVEAFKCTYYLARDASMHEAYDKLVDRAVLRSRKLAVEAFRRIADTITRGTLGAARGAPAIDIPWGSGYEMILGAEHVGTFKTALQEGLIDAVRLRIGF